MPSIVCLISRFIGKHQSLLCASASIQNSYIYLLTNDCVFKISVEPGKEDKQIIHFFPQVMCVSRCETKVNIYFHLYMEIVVKKSLHIFCECYCDFRASLVAQLVNNPPAKQETLVQFLGWEDPLEKG